ncbi:MAG: hypothetical protein DCC56_01675 [Anaerolineae bacterium]|nr:MAG: hypothetical protein DCC56_01675 [Anaerolineae bacterium]WKZ44746.1 MAG: hypothetical protein QY302_03020 [Anaerolineales bacterium]
MSKKNKKQKYRKQRQKQRVPWIVLAIGGVMLVFAAFLFARQGGDDGGGTPSIAVDQQLIDYGDVKFNTNKTFAVKVTNTGDGTLRFKEKPYVQVLEGC